MSDAVEAVAEAAVALEIAAEELATAELAPPVPPGGIVEIAVPATPVMEDNLEWLARELLPLLPAVALITERLADCSAMMRSLMVLTSSIPPVPPVLEVPPLTSSIAEPESIEPATPEPKAEPEPEPVHKRYRPRV